jgi:hypothetical protein
MQQIADKYEVARSDIRSLIAQYPGDVRLWEDTGVLIPKVSDDLCRVLSPHDERDIQH